MNIYFVGNLKSPFIKQDVELLQEDYKVTTFDLSVHTSYNIEVIKYWLKSLSQWKEIRNTDIIWVWFAIDQAIPFILLSKIFHKPIIVNIGGWEVYSAKEINFGNQLNLIGGFISRWIIKNATCCIVPSESYKTITLKLVPKSTIKVIPNWVDSKICSEPLPEKKDIIITAVCSSESYIRKGIPIFNEVAKEIPYDMRVLYRLPRSEYIQLLRESRVYCQLSYTESFGISLLEAMAYGCIPVVTDRDALPWVVGDTGVIVPYGDIEKTKDAILKAMDMDRKPARDRARLFSREGKKIYIKDLIRKLTQQISL